VSPPSRNLRKFDALRAAALCRGGASAVSTEISEGVRGTEKPRIAGRTSKREEELSET